MDTILAKYTRLIHETVSDIGTHSVPGAERRRFFVSHEPQHTTFVAPELERQDIENVLSRKQDEAEVDEATPCR